MAKVKSNDDSRAKHKAISGRLSIILASSWVKTVVFCLLKTFIVWLS